MVKCSQKLSADQGKTEEVNDVESSKKNFNVETEQSHPVRNSNRNCNVELKQDDRIYIKATDEKLVGNEGIVKNVSTVQLVLSEFEIIQSPQASPI